MHALWPRLVVAVLLTAGPFAAQAADAPATTAAPQRLVVDSESAPVLSIHDAAQLVDIVLIPNGDYHPVHPDSVEPETGDGASDADDPR
ncbi:MAG: hypothetical protein ACOYXU_01575 [Nitrospirota bacterium]